MTWEIPKEAALMWEYKMVAHWKDLVERGTEGWEAYAVTTDSDGALIWHLKRPLKKNEANA